MSQKIVFVLQAWGPDFESPDVGEGGQAWLCTTALGNRDRQIQSSPAGQPSWKGSIKDSALRQ